MSVHSPSSSIEDELGKRERIDKEDSTKKSTGPNRGGGRARIYLHAVTDAQANLLENTGFTQPLQEVKKKTGADVHFDSNPSPVPGMKILVIRGVPTQIEAAVRLISEMTKSQGTLLDEAQTFWLQWVEAAFPDLDSSAYFLPPVYFNRVPMSRQSVAGQDVLVLQATHKLHGQSNKQAIGSFVSARAQDRDDRNDAAKERVDGQNLIQAEHVQAYQSSQPKPASFTYPRVQDSDIRDDAGLQRVLISLQKMSERNKEVLVGLSQLQFGQYLGEPCYASAAAQLPLPANLHQALPRNWKQGDFDVLLIHRHHGLVVCEVKMFGDNTQTLNMSQQDIVNSIRKKLREAVSQLDKAEAMLSHLVSDIAPCLRITKTIAVPNLTARQVQQAISCDTHLNLDLCRCLGTTTTDPADIPGLCLCCDQLSDPKTPWDVSSHVLRELRHWWQRLVAGAEPDSHMTRRVYKTLVARFCGPATTVSVPCTCPPRVSVKTLGQAVWWTGQCYTAVITLFPEQVQLLNKADPRVFVSGPPGTGKTVVLLLMAIEWLRGGHDVYIISVWLSSRAACTMLYYLLDHSLRMQQTSGVTPDQLHLLKYDFSVDKATEKAVSDLSKAAEKGSLHVIADETGSENFQTFCDELLTRVPDLHLWAASCFHGDAPAGWQVEYLTRPLRSPPAVVREVALDPEINDHKRVKPYSERGVPHHTDGPPVRRLYHGGQGHSGQWPVDCKMCGDEVSRFLKSLRNGETSANRESVSTTSSTADVRGETTPPCVQWRDILVLDWGQPKDNSGIIEGLREAGIPVRVMKDDDIDDVATAHSDVVWVADGEHVRGLERKVVVCLESPCVNDQLLIRLDNMSRCTSQLVIISSEEHRFDGISPTEYFRTWRDSLCCVC